MTKLTNHTENISHTLQYFGFEQETKITDTLQGAVYRASKNYKTNSVIKVTKKILHETRKAIVSGRVFNVTENIVTESKILQYLSQQRDCPKSIIKFQQFFSTDTNFYLVMEDGGTSLFNFVQKAHGLIKLGKIEVNDWKTVVKTILKQMIECIHFIHSHNICHTDISIENFIISDVQIIVTDKDKIKFDADTVQVKLCDFGLAQLFTTDKCISSAHVGKTKYKSPEVINKNGYMAKMNDVWCMGVCLLILITGHPMWTKACVNDELFVYFMNGYMMEMLKGWNIAHYFDNDLLCIIDAIFKYESQRVDINVLKQWINKLEI
eukprot:59252_1